MPELVLPTTSVRESFLEAMDEFVAEGVELSQTAAWIDHNAPGWQRPRHLRRLRRGGPRRRAGGEPAPGAARAVHDAVVGGR